MKNLTYLKSFIKVLLPKLIEIKTPNLKLKREQNSMEVLLMKMIYVSMLGPI